LYDHYILQQLSYINSQFIIQPKFLNTEPFSNYVKFFNRLRILETVHGPFLYKRTKKGPVARPIEIEDVKRMIGLDTNASEIPRSKFIARIEKDLL
jgi:hypothetical protein